MILSLTYETAIPTHARGAVRSFLKGRPGWERWIAGHNTKSNEAKNAQLIQFAIEGGYDAQVVALINGTANLSPTTGNVVQPYQPGGLVLPAAIEAEVLADAEAQPELAADLADETMGLQAVAPVEAIRADSILAGVDQFLSPFVRAEIEKALAPVIEAANKPAIETIIEKVVTVPAAQVAPAGQAPYATPGNKVPFGQLFGFKHALGKVPVTLWESHGAAPAIDPMYVVDADHMLMMGTALEAGTNVWLGGPGGSGKTSLPIQFAAFTGRPCIKFSFTGQMNVDDLLGGTGVKGGDTSWQDGALIAAVKRPGMVIVLDELTTSKPGVQAIFHSFCDEHRSYTIPLTGEVVRCAPGVVFVVCDNTFGGGDDTGLYHGTNQVNGALVNRFGVMMRIDYMSEAVEAQALHNHVPAAPLAACQHLAGFVAKARKLPEMENVILSLRNMTAFLRRSLIGFTPKQALEVTMLNQLPATERAALETLFTLSWANEFASLIAGNPAQAVIAPASPSAAAFDDEISASLAR